MQNSGNNKIERPWHVFFNKIFHWIRIHVGCMEHDGISYHLFALLAVWVQHDVIRNHSLS